MVPRATLPLLTLLALNYSAAYNPGETAPDFTVPTLKGPLLVGGRDRTWPLLVTAYSAEDPFSRTMWTDPSSLSGLLQRSPEGIHHLFVSYSEATAKQDAQWMHDQLRTHANRIWMPWRKREALFERLHFATVPVSRVPGALPSVLREWTYGQRVMDVTVLAQGGRPSARLTLPRLDWFYAWLNGGQMHDGAIFTPAPAALAGSDCDWIPAGGAIPLASQLKGKVAVVTLNRLPSEGIPAPCSYHRLAVAATQAEVSALVLVAPPSIEPVQGNCTDGPPSPLNSATKCFDGLWDASALFTMVSRTAAAPLLAALQAGGTPPTANFTEVARPGLVAGFGARNRLFEVGWLKFPSLMTAVWAAEHLVYMRQLTAKLAAPALMVPVFARQPITGSAPIKVEVTMPSARQLTGMNKLEVDMNLGCPPPNRDAFCPSKWDRVVQGFVCCDNADGSPPSCDPCPVTFAKRRRQLLAAGDGDEDAGKQESFPGLGASGGDVCGRELARYTTSYKRCGGRWLTDVTPLMPLLPAGQKCRFTFQMPPWASDRWIGTLNLRFSKQATPAPAHGGQQAKPVGAPTRLLPLPFLGGTFNSTYNVQQPVFKFVTPRRLKRAVITSVITGHGYDPFGCGEFCTTVHWFAVNGKLHSRPLGPRPGSNYGCADAVLEGGMPNDKGAWMLGRAGWCNGRDVKPWVIDITNQLAPAGQTNKLRYAALFNGTQPLPEQKTGTIMLSANLVLWEAQS